MNALERAIRGGRHDWQLQLSSVLSVGVAFICLASALLVVANVQELRVRWSHTGRASVYLQPSAEPSDIDAVAQQMAAARKALDRSFVQLLTSAIQTQSLNAADLGDAQARAAQLAALLDKFA